MFRETGQVVSVFQDKHLSYDWHKATWMVDQAKDLDFPLMAGSVLPLAHHPDLRWEFGKPIDKAVWTWEASFVGNKDSYGFHALEELQSRVERRTGGETGVSAVQCLEGDPVWEWTDARRWAKTLLKAVAPKLSRKEIKDPILFALEYCDGLETAIYRLNGHRRGDSPRFAALVPGKRDPIVLPTVADTPSPVALPEELRDRYPVVNHFSTEVHLIEEMILTGRVPNPVERALLTTGTLAALFESSYQRAQNYGATYQHGQFLEEGRRIETPHLHIPYQIDDDG